MDNKKLTRSDNRMLAGVCAGLAEYFGTDVTLVRVIYALLTFFTAFSGVIDDCYARKKQINGHMFVVV